MYREFWSCMYHHNTHHFWFLSSGIMIAATAMSRSTVVCFRLWARACSNLCRRLSRHLITNFCHTFAVRSQFWSSIWRESEVKGLIVLVENNAPSGWRFRIEWVVEPIQPWERVKVRCDHTVHIDRNAVIWPLQSHCRPTRRRQDPKMVWNRSGLEKVPLTPMSINFALPQQPLHQALMNHLVGDTDVECTQRIMSQLASKDYSSFDNVLVATLRRQ